MEIRVGGGQFFVNGYPIKERFTLKEGETRLLSCISHEGGSCGEISIRDGALRAESGFEMIRWRGGVELRPLPSETFGRSETLRLGGKCVTVTVGREILLHGDYTLTHRAICPVFAPAVRALEGQWTPILEIRGRTDDGDYLALLSLENGGATVLLEVTGESVVTSENEVLVTRRLRDRRRRVLRLRYVWRGRHFEETSREIECTYAPLFIREEAGRLLMEAVAARDEKELKCLVTEDVADMRALVDYLGAFEAIRTPLFSSSPTAIALQKNTSNGVVAVTYDFTFEGDRIKNILCEED